MKKLLITILLTALAVSAYAQPKNGFDSDLGTYDRVTVHGPYLTNKFGQNWFIGVAGGVNLYFGTHDAAGDFGKRLAPAIDASIGKWITPNVGFRLQYAGLEARGFSKFNSPYTVSGPDNGSLYKEKFNLISGHADVLYNMSNAWGGFRNDRTWNFIGFVGFGVAHSDKNGFKSNQFAPSFGLLNNIRVSDVIDITLEARGLMVKNDFDKVDTKTMVEVNFSLTAGLTFKLGPKGGFKRPVYVAPADYTPYQNRINSLENDLNNAKSSIDRLNRDLDDCRNRPQTVVESKCMHTTISAFFPIGKATISDKDMVNIEHIAKTIKQNPTRKFTVTGYADSNTGSTSINQRLSDQRAENVANELVKLGVNRSQLVVDGKGGVHADRNPSLYRVVVIEEAD